MKAYKSIRLLILLIFLVLLGCASPDKKAESPPTATIAPAPTLTTLPFSIAQPSLIPSVSLTLDAEKTLTQDEINTQFIALLQDNGGCRLPCLWGIYPGDDEKFALLYRKMSNVLGGIRIQQNDEYFELSFLGEGNDELSYFGTSSYKQTEQGNKYLYDSPTYRSIFKYYSLSNVLSLYGIPEQAYVLIDNGIADMGLGIDLYFLYIVYPEQGWMVSYKMELREKDGFFIGCPQEAFVGIYIKLPGAEAKKAFHLGGTPLQKATSLTLEEFYTQFRDAAPNTCLKARIDSIP